MKKQIYVASSWRNGYQPAVVEALREDGHIVYDFRNPPGGTGFSWREVDPAWSMGDPVEVDTYRAMLAHPISLAGFDADFDGMREAQFGVLVLPCGRSAHIEAGWLLGRGIPLAIYVPEPMEPELMYLLAGEGRLCESLEEVRGLALV